MPTHLQSPRLFNISWSTGAANLGSTEQGVRALPGCRGFSRVLITANVARMSSDTQQHNLGVSPGHQPPICTTQESLGPPAPCASPGSSPSGGFVPRTSVALALLGKAGGRRGQGLNLGLGELKYSKHKADVALPDCMEIRDTCSLCYGSTCAQFIWRTHIVFFFFFCLNPSRVKHLLQPRVPLQHGASPPRTEGVDSTSSS